MSIKLMAQVWTYCFTHGEQSILLAMADHADDDGNNCYPSVPRLAWKTGYSERQVQRILQSLVKRGVLEIAAPATNRRPTEYNIRLHRAKPKPPYVPPSRGDILSPQESRGDICDMSRGDISDARGDICDMSGGDMVSDKPSIEPSIEPPEEKPGETRRPPVRSQTEPLDFGTGYNDRYKPRQRVFMDDLNKRVAAHGLTMAEFRQIVDRYLEIYGQLAAVDAGTAHGDRLHSEAQDACATLLAMGVRTPDALAALIEHFCTTGWDGRPLPDNKRRTLPTSKQLIEFAGQRKAAQLGEQGDGEHHDADRKHNGNDIDYTELARAAQRARGRRMPDLSVGDIDF